jgi:hypothetical protein
LFFFDHSFASRGRRGFRREFGDRRRRYVQSIQRVLESPEPARQAQAPQDVNREEILGSDAMLAAMAWLDQYFAIGVDYSEAEVAEFRRRLEVMSSVQLHSFLTDFERERRMLAHAHAGGVDWL